MPAQDKTAKLIEVFETDIEKYENLYIDGLGGGAEELENNPTKFTGLLKFIYAHAFKPTRLENRGSGRSSTRIDLNNTALLDSVWEHYCAMCYRYGNKPSILGYCTMIGISKGTVNNWKNGNSRFNAPDSLSGMRHNEMVEKWRNEEELNLWNSTSEKNSIGSMFLLKSCYGYQEKQVLEVQNTGNTPEQTALDIAARHAITEKDLPEMPTFDD